MAIHYTTTTAGNTGDIQYRSDVQYWIDTGHVTPRTVIGEYSFPMRVGHREWPKEESKMKLFDVYFVAKKSHRITVKPVVATGKDQAIMKATHAMLGEESDPDGFHVVVTEVATLPDE